MRSRSVLFVLSLVAFALAAAPAAEAGKSKSARQKRVAAQKRAAARKAAPPVKDQHGPTSLGATRQGGEATGGQHPTGLPRQEAVSSAVAGTSGRAVQRKAPVRRQSRTTTASAQRPHDLGAAPVVSASTRPAFDTSAAVAPKRRGRVKRFFAGIAVAAALTLGAVGWQAADMNTKVGDAWNFITTQISQVWDGGGNTGPLPPDPPSDPGGPPIPPSDPGPPIPPSDPGPTDPPQQDPGQQTPSPSGGHGKQTPKGPETDRSR